MSGEAAVLASGGVDSSVLLAELAAAGRRVFPIYVRTGLLWEDAELHWLRRFLAVGPFEGCEPLRVFELPVGDLYGAHWSVTGSGTPGFESALDSNYLPGRNLLLLAKVAVFCELERIGAIALAPLADNPFPDGRPGFFRAFEEVAAIAFDRRIKIEIPFRSLQKVDIIRRGRQWPLHLTFSCIRPVGIEHCGDCTKCAERQHGFAAAGVEDRTHYHRTRLAGGQ
jgi:7-cyano-7-deazaguanine synthase